MSLKNIGLIQGCIKLDNGYSIVSIFIYYYPLFSYVARELYISIFYYVYSFSVLCLLFKLLNVL